MNHDKLDIGCVSPNPCTVAAAVVLDHNKAMIQTGALGSLAVTSLVKSPTITLRSTVSPHLLMLMDYPSSKPKASLCLENLPVGILVQIQKHLDGRHIIVLRKVSMLVFYLFD